MKTAKTVLLTAACAITTALAFSQNLKSFNQNSSRSNWSSLKDVWTFSVNPGLGYIVNSHATPGTDAARLGSNFSGQYYFGNVGLGISGGIMASSISKDAVSKFLSDRNYPADATITKSNPSNSYLLFGPAIRFGNKVLFGAELSGGLFLNNTGSLIVTPQGSPRPIYSTENGDKNLFPGFSGNVHIDYPINNSTHFFISTGYLQTKSSNLILDIKQGIDIPKLQNQDLKLFTAGIGIRKSFGGRKGENSDGLSASTNGGYTAQNRGDIKYPRDASSGLPTGKRSYFRGNQNNGNTGTTSCGPVSLRTTNTDGSISEMTFACPQDAANFRAHREPPTESYNPWEMDDDVEGTVMNPLYGNDGNNTSSSSSCGPVTIRTTNPDGTVTETTFACPQDAAQFQQRSSSVNSLNNSMPSRLSMTPTTAKQTQGKTFGEKLSTGLNSGRSIHWDSATRNNILFGKISHWASSSEAYGIATNKSKGIGGTTTKPGGMTSSSYAAGKIRNGTYNGGPGTINLSIQEKGRGKSASNTQYQLVYSDDTNSTLENADITVNPLYQSTGNTHENPLFKANSKSISTGGGDEDSDGIPELMVSLIDPVNGAVLASTKTEANGDFYFANLPTGTYAVKVEGVVTQKKGYEVSIKKKLDIAGQIVNCDESWAVEIKHATGTAEQAAAYVQKTRTKSNNSNDRLMNIANDNSGLVWSPRSNFKVMPMAIGDVDSDGYPEMVVGTVVSDPATTIALRPGGPIKGIIVKGGRNPGGDIVVQGRTNANGEFEFTNLQPGSYNITMEGTIILDDLSFVIVGDEQNNNLSKSGVQDHNSSRSNKTASVIEPNDDNSNERKGGDGTVKGGSKSSVQDHNSSRSNKSSVIEPNDDNSNERKGGDGTVKGGSKSGVQDHNSSRSNKSSVIEPNDNNNNSNVIVRGWDPKKKESIQRNINTSQDNLKSLSAELDKLEQQMKRARRDIWGSGGSTNGKIENLRAAIADVQQTLNTLQQKDKEAALSELDQKTSAMNKQFAELQNSLSGMGNEYTSISNTLKTKHDTVKNSINNVR